MDSLKESSRLIVAKMNQDNLFVEVERWCIVKVSFALFQLSFVRLIKMVKDRIRTAHQEDCLQDLIISVAALRKRCSGLKPSDFNSQEMRALLSEQLSVESFRSELWLFTPHLNCGIQVNHLHHNQPHFWVPYIWFIHFMQCWFTHATNTDWALQYLPHCSLCMPYVTWCHLESLLCTLLH